MNQVACFTSRIGNGMRRQPFFLQMIKPFLQIIGFLLLVMCIMLYHVAKRHSEMIMSTHVYLNK